jgi:hypothetical protein
MTYEEAVKKAWVEAGDEYAYLTDERFLEYLLKGIDFPE